MLYKATVRDDEWSVHTPRADNPYVLRLSENQRPFWSPVVGVLLKGQLEIEEKSKVKESIEPNLTKPHKVEGTEWKRKRREVLHKSLLLLERLLEKVASVQSVIIMAVRKVWVLITERLYNRQWSYEPQRRQDHAGLRCP